MKQSPVVHFEMPVKDKARVSKFYKEAFGWNMQIMGQEYGGYVLATTTESTDKGPVKPGAINGGFFEYKDEPGFTAPHIVIEVEDIKEAVEGVKKAGGQIQSGPMDIPGIGQYVSFTDSEGNGVGMLQPPAK